MVSHFVRKPAIDFGNPAHTTSDVSRGSSKRSPLELKRLTKCRPRIERYALPWARTSRPDEGRFFTSIPLGWNRQDVRAVRDVQSRKGPGVSRAEAIFDLLPTLWQVTALVRGWTGYLPILEVTGVFRSLACKSATPFRNCIVVPEAL